MIRRWRVEPDIEVNTADGPVYAVSQEALAVAAMDAVTLLHRAGGVFQVVVERFPTGLPGEMVTTGAVVEWRHRTDAKPEPERVTAERLEALQAEPTVTTAMSDRARAVVESVEPPPEDDPTQYRGGEFRDTIGDGIDESALPDEDESAVEERV